MRINRMNRISEIYKANTKKPVSRKDAGHEKDSLAISQFGRDLQIAKNAVNKVPDIRMEKIADLKRQVDAGTYNVSAKEVADKLVEHYFDTKA